MAWAKYRKELAREASYLRFVVDDVCKDMKQWAEDLIECHIQVKGADQKILNI